MKKKSPRGIPDFAPKKPGFGPLSKIDNEKGVRPAPPPPPRVKPPSTSAKSGRRGS